MFGNDPRVKLGKATFLSWTDLLVLVENADAADAEDDDAEA